MWVTSLVCWSRRNVLLSATRCRALSDCVCWRELRAFQCMTRGLDLDNCRATSHVCGGGGGGGGGVSTHMFRGQYERSGQACCANALALPQRQRSALVWIVQHGKAGAWSHFAQQKTCISCKTSRRMARSVTKPTSRPVSTASYKSSAHPACRPTSHAPKCDFLASAQANLHNRVYASTCSSEQSSTQNW